MTIRLAAVLAGAALVAGTGSAGASPARAERFRTERARAERAVRQLAPGGRVSVHWQAHRTRPTAIRGLSLRVAGATDTARAERFLAAHPELFVGGDSRLAALDVRETTSRRVVRFRQLFRGLPVVGARVLIALDREGRVRAVRSGAEPIALTTTKPAVSRTDAARAVAGALRLAAASPAPARAELAVLPGATARLIYRVQLPARTDPTARVHWVDARTGAYLGARPTVNASWRRPAPQEVRP